MTNNFRKHDITTDNTPAGLAVRHFFAVMRNQVERNDEYGSWPGGDTVEALCEFFVAHGFDLNGPKPKFPKRDKGFAEAVESYQQASKAYGEASDKLRRMSDEAEEGDGGYVDADDFRNYGHAESVEDALARAETLLAMLGFPPNYTTTDTETVTPEGNQA